MSTELTVACIARNEAEQIGRMIKSVTEVAQHCLIHDTGSNDTTVSIAQSLGATVELHTWNDNYADARNHLLEKIKKGWVLMLDADEELHPSSKETVKKTILGKSKVYNVIILHKFNHDYITYYLPTQSSRLFVADKQIRYSGAFHESLEPSLKKVMIYPTQSEIRIIHHGFVSTKTTRKLRNRPFFVRDHQADPTNYWLNFHLGMGYIAEGDYKKAEPFLQMILRSTDKDINSDVRTSIMALLASAMIDSELFVQARTQLQRAMQVKPDNLLAKAILAKLEIKSGQIEQSVNKLTALLAAPYDPYLFTLRRDRIYTEIIKSLIQLKRNDDAYHYCEIAYDFPNYETMMIGGMLAEVKKEYSQAIRFFEKAKLYTDDTKKADERINICQLNLANTQ